ncbi:amidohydrolase family protein [Agrilactobacillus yilanensis]|uniref:Amidohydrolase family protein n=1 Tax=Agrilactobacillus yilanensis TaxID=2485997 RepID=A0ABW4J6P4_9LACO|nr:amidohydrolase family protein [Agrilactobacillus yilanensis]
MLDILIKNATYFDEDFQLTTGDIAIKDGYFVTYDGQEAAQSVVASDKTWLPGLVDNHIHISQQFLQGQLLFQRPIVWQRINVPFEAALDEALVQLSTKAAVATMIKNGTTSFVDSGCPKALAMVEVLDELKIRGHIGYQTADLIPFETLKTTPKAAFDRNLELIKVLKDNPLIAPILGITTLPATTPALQENVLLYGKEQQVMTSCHMNEYESEILTTIVETGLRPYEYLEKIGAMHAKFLGPHSLFLSENEKTIIQENQSQVVHCPFSNSAKGIPETDALLARQIRTYLGTDGAGHGGLDMFREMRLFSAKMQLHAKAKGDYALVNTRDILKMATTSVEPLLGKIKVGYKADLISLDTNNLDYLSGKVDENTLIEIAKGGHVNDSIINGDCVMRDRELLTIDEDRLKADLQAYQKQVKTAVTV